MKKNKNLDFYGVAPANISNAKLGRELSPQAIKLLSPVKQATPSTSTQPIAKKVSDNKNITDK